MTLNEYQQKTHETAVYPSEHAKEYLLLGLAGEVGEICNKYKKTIRDNKQIDKDDMISELGDVMWYFSELCTFLNIELKNIFYHALKTFNIPCHVKNYEQVTYELFNSIDAVNRLHCSIWTELDHIDEINFILSELSISTIKLYNIFNTSLNEVLTKNIAKLQDRKNRGVIQGSGDNR
jgi:NTP pyrophosphatase (non-canonical NTP hydrolase)